MESNLSSFQAKERKNEILITFSNMITYASNHQVVVIIIAGDLFDTSYVSGKTRSYVLDQIRDHKDIDFLYLSGNHDESNFISSIEDKPQNLRLFSDRWQTFLYGSVAITGVQLSGKGTSLYDELVLDKEQTNIVVMHGQEANYKVDEGAEIINIRALKNKQIDYLALGHLHTHKTEALDDRGIYCYAGCLEGRGFDECGDKGFVLLDINEGKITHEFIKFAKRTIYEKDVDITGCLTIKEIVDAIKRELAGIPSESLIKVILKGEFTVNTQKDLDHLTSELNDQFYYVKIYDQTRLALKVEDFQYDISLKGEFVRQVIASDMDEKRKNAVIIYGLKALSGEEID
jgi:DNA repair exonuclease SbcCD nuclease subunit